MPFRLRSIQLFHCLILGVITITIVSCGNDSTTPPVNFYYWKSGFKLFAQEKAALHDNGSTKLYLKYFDVELDKDRNITRPISVITFEDSIPTIGIVPVVYLKNEIFENNKDTASFIELATKVIDLISQINKSQKILVNELQIDCDWAKNTANNYFCFLRALRKICKARISATIRLHQIKYAGITKVPPVDKGVLMFYNMGKISADQQNSIMDNGLAAKYINFIKSYPMPLDIALPIFSWGIKSRDGKVNELLNKMNEVNFLNDTNFTMQTLLNFKVKHSCFKSGYYFMKGEDVKIETVTKEQLLEAAEDLGTYFERKPELLFYDLDTVNLKRYEKTIFKEVMAKFN